MSVVPASLARKVSAFRDGEGVPWLQRLPALLADCGARWQLRLGSPFDGGSLNFVAPAQLPDGRDAVLKAGFLADELTAEIAALRLCDGHGMARLLDADEARGVLLIERLRPGTPLTAESDDDATSAAAMVMSRLWRPLPPDHPFPTVARWAAGLARLRDRFGGGTGPLPAPLVDRAESLMADLLASAPPDVLLHGDLHRGNLLRAEREPWLAIDPKGVAGEPAFETAAFVRDGWDQDAAPARLMARHIAVLAEALALDRERVRDWAFAGAVLSAWWSIEDEGDGWEGAMRCAECLAALP